jgi:hypothetical protein
MGSPNELGYPPLRHRKEAMDESLIGRRGSRFRCAEKRFPIVRRRATAILRAIQSKGRAWTRGYSEC